MIQETNYSKKAIQDITKQHFKSKEPQLVEKILMALALLELLAEEEFEFIFKGGTCLLILLDKPKRFSIDIDLIIQDQSKLLIALENICKNSKIFTRFEEDKRKKSKKPKAHYNIYYQSKIEDEERFVLIDIMIEKSPYSIQQSSEIKNKYFHISEPYQKVETPTIDGILGDKLTAFAPRTTGKKLGKNEELEIAKQLFDVASLFDHATNINIIKETFKTIALSEIKYRELPISYPDVLQDTFTTSKIIALSGSLEPKIYEELERGTTQLKNYIFKNFGTIEVHICAAKAAYLSQIILKDASQINRFNKKQDISKIEITQEEYKELNNLKKISPEAFYYWKLAVDLI